MSRKTLDPSWLDNAHVWAEEQRRRAERFETLKDCEHIFPPRQWAAVCLAWRDGLLNDVIADRLGIKPRSVANLLSRALALYERHQQQIRREHLRLLRKHEEW